MNSLPASRPSVKSARPPRRVARDDTYSDPAAFSWCEDLPNGRPTRSVPATVPVQCTFCGGHAGAGGRHLSDGGCDIGPCPSCHGSCYEQAVIRPHADLSTCRNLGDLANGIAWASNWAAEQANDAVARGNGSSGDRTMILFSAKAEVYAQCFQALAGLLVRSATQQAITAPVVEDDDGIDLATLPALMARAAV